jgi:predicted metal-dependent HD superfamily phosphohydrolase
MVSEKPSDVRELLIYSCILQKFRYSHILLTMPLLGRLARWFHDITIFDGMMKHHISFVSRVPFRDISGIKWPTCNDKVQKVSKRLCIGWLFILNLVCL